MKHKGQRTIEYSIGLAVHLAHKTASAHRPTLASRFNKQQASTSNFYLLSSILLAIRYSSFASLHASLAVCVHIRSRFSILSELGHGSRFFLWCGLWPLLSVICSSEENEKNERSGAGVIRTEDRHMNMNH